MRGERNYYYYYDYFLCACIKTLTLKHKSIITPENVSLVKFKYLRNGESLTTRADKFDLLRATGKLAFEPNLVESVGGVESCSPLADEIVREWDRHR